MKRSIIWSGLFGGVGFVLLVWLMTSETDTATEQARARAVDARGAGEAPGFGRDVHPLQETRRTELSERREPKRKGTIIRGHNRPAIAGPGAQRRSLDPDAPLPLDQDGVKAAVDGHRRDLDGCFRTALLHSPQMPSDHTLSIQVQPEDGGANSEIQSITTDATDASVLESCMTAAMSGVRFVGSQTTTIRVPVALNAE